MVRSQLQRFAPEKHQGRHRWNSSWRLGRRRNSCSWQRLGYSGRWWISRPHLYYPLQPHAPQAPFNLCSLSAPIISCPHSGILPLPPLTVCAPYSPYPPPPSHQASLPSPSSPQRYSDSGCIPMMLHLLYSRFFCLIFCISLVASVPLSGRVVANGCASVWWREAWRMGQ